MGAQAGRNAIVTYTEDDCVADEDSLFYLVRGLLDRTVAAIGGPNIRPGRTTESQMRGGEPREIPRM